MSAVTPIRPGLPPLSVQLGLHVIQLARLFDPVEFLAGAVLPAKRVPLTYAAAHESAVRQYRERQANRVIDLLAYDKAVGLQVTRELELRQRNARNLLRWISRRDAQRDWNESRAWSELARQMHDEAQS